MAQDTERRRLLGLPGPRLLRQGQHDRRRRRQLADLRGAVARRPGEDLAQRPFQHLLRIAPQLDGLPRHVGIHNGGMVLTEKPLCEIVPLEPATMEGRTVTQWDKEGLAGAGLVKVDILGLRMLSAIEDAVTIVETQTGTRPDLSALAPT